MKGKVSGFIALAMVAGLLAVGVPANAREHRTIWVHHGQSIQKAVNRAHPGDRIIVLDGVYHQSVLIRKNNLTLIGRHAVIKPPAQAPDNLCTLAFGPSGICVIAKDVDPNTGEVFTYVRNVRISGFTVRDFEAMGIAAYGSKHVVVRHNRALNNGEYGVVSFNSSGNRYIENVASGAGEAGFYYGDSPDADAVIWGNVAYDNLFGTLIRNASEGVIAHNRTYENCVGTLFLAGAPGPATDWTYTHNKVWDNDKACAATEEGAPALSGVGVMISGASHIRVVHNWITHNHPKGETAVSGGVVVIGSIADPSFVPNHNLVAHNVIEHNVPYDIVYDGSGADNIFTHNYCATSVPGGLC